MVVHDAAFILFASAIAVNTITSATRSGRGHIRSMVIEREQAPWARLQSSSLVPRRTRNSDDDRY